MSKILIDEATVKLALEALKVSVPVILGNFSRHSKAIAALEALAEPDFWEGYVPEPVKPAQCKYPKCSYPCTDLPDCRDAEQPAQQALDKKAANAKELGLDYEPVWGGGPTNKDYEDAMRQRRLHQLTPPPAQRTWVGLSKEDKWEIVQATERDDRGYVMALVEARLKELNT